MTENEVKDYLGDLITEGQYIGDKIVARDDEETLRVAIKVLEEIQQYRTIETFEECQNAIEKQKAKKPTYEGDGYADGELVYDTWICPNCGEHYETDYDDYIYCPNCGQAIDLSEVN